MGFKDSASVLVRNAWAKERTPPPVARSNRASISIGRRSRFFDENHLGIFDLPTYDHDVHTTQAF